MEYHLDIVLFSLKFAQGDGDGGESREVRNKLRAELRLVDRLRARHLAALPVMYSVQSNLISDRDSFDLYLLS